MGHELSLSLALWLAAPAGAHPCRLRELQPAPGAPVYGHLYFDRRVAPLAAADERALKALRPEYPECADGSHLLDESGDCLSFEGVKRLLDEPRRARLARALESLDGRLETYRSRRLAGARPAWTHAEAQAVRDLLRLNGDVLPADVRARFEGWLKDDGHGLGAGARLPSASALGGGGFLQGELDRAFAQSGAAFGAPGAPAPERVDIRALDAAIDAATWTDPKTGQARRYEPEVRRVLRVVAYYADPKDARDAIDILTRVRPHIGPDPDGLFPGQGGAMTLPEPEKGRPQFTIRYNPAYLVTRGVALRSAPGAYRDLLGETPNLSPYRGARPLWTRRKGGVIHEGYRDATVVRFTDVELAATLLHELIHIRTRELGAGAVVPINEEASRQPEMRLIDNYARVEAKAPADFLSEDTSKAYLSWKHDRPGYRERMQRLLADPLAYHVEDREATPEGLAETLRGQLSLKGRAFHEAKLAELTKYVDAQAGMLKDELERLREAGVIGEARLQAGLRELERQRTEAFATEAPSDEEWRRRLEEQMAQIPQDRRLRQELAIDDALWRQRYQSSLPLP